MSKTLRPELALRLTLMSVGILMLAACGAPQDPPAPRVNDATGSDVIGEPLHNALDKAKSVEDLSGQRKGGLDDAIDAAQ
ncbi:MAG: hypothetical protein R3F24_09655 [Gammaproteobacteria bacterium]